MVTEFIPFGSRINEYFEGCIKKKPLKSYDFKGFNSICFPAGGERGIRTPGPVTVNSFQDCRIRPLCHFSSLCYHLQLASANISTLFGLQKQF